MKNKTSLILAAGVLTAMATISAYGEETFTDPRDGQKYRTVKIGGRTWMAENLNYEMRFSSCYDNKESNCVKYGRLYTWEAAQDACPSGFRLPSEKEFDELTDISDTTSEIGKKFKSQSGWNKNGNGTDDFGFAALPAGYKEKNFKEIGNRASFWTTAKDFCDQGGDGPEREGICAWGWGFLHNSTGAYAFLDELSAEMSVRCINDEPKAETLKRKLVDESDIAQLRKEGQTFTDPRDGKEYRLTEIGQQTWMAENLSYKSPKSYCYEDSVVCSRYGRLYTWESALGACPDGWHLPNKSEFLTLFESIGGQQTAGKKLKSEKGWRKRNSYDIGKQGLDTHGFSAFPAGSRNQYDNFIDLGESTSFWTSSQNNDNQPVRTHLSYSQEQAYLSDFNDKKDSYSIRCVKGPAIKEVQEDIKPQKPRKKAGGGGIPRGRGQP